MIEPPPIISFQAFLYRNKPRETVPEPYRSELNAIERWKKRTEILIIYFALLPVFAVGIAIVTVIVIGWKLGL